ncbi:MAG: cytochrome P450 [Flavobacteriales bacterium]|nr:cytochrome P450 [Flavobacteriales bacterium]
MLRILEKVKRLILPETSMYGDPMELHLDADKFLDKEDVVYFRKIKAYGVFKYPLVRDIMLSGNPAIGVSSVALGLNSIYFSQDEKVHTRNKKVAVEHLTFLTPKLQHSDNEFTRGLFDLFYKDVAKNEQVDLTDCLINPIVFIHVLMEYDLLETVFTDLNPESESFTSCDAIDIVQSFLTDGDILESIIANYLENGGQITEKMKDFANELRPGMPLKPEEFPNFLRSIIFVAIETTTSFVSTFIYTLFNQYSSLIEQGEYRKEVYSIANELLRIYPPVPFVYRTVWKDTSYRGVNLKKGALVILFLGAANRDPGTFEKPMVIMPGRKQTHLSFGVGSYACIGRFAGFRMAMNMLDYLLPHKNKIEFLNKDAKHHFHNAIQKLPLKAIVR